MTHLHADRFFSGDNNSVHTARSLYEGIANLPIISPHGHTDPKWFDENQAFSDATSLYLTPDHYVLRMLRSQGISYDDLGVARKNAAPTANNRDAWTLFANNYHLFTGTPSQTWIDHSLDWAFGITRPLTAQTADVIYDEISAKLALPDFLPMALLDRAKVETIATTEFALDPLSHHKAMKADGKIGRIRTTYRPDDVTDPDNPNFKENLAELAALTNQDTGSWAGLIDAHRARRAFFRDMGATATDHAAPTAATADLAPAEKQALLTRLLSGPVSANDAELFRAQMMTEMAMLSVEDGMVLQFHAGTRRNTDPSLMDEYGANLGADIPLPIDPVRGLEPLLHKFGNAQGFQMIFFCMDETVLSRELAPMAGYWPALRLGPPWWFHDSPRGIARYLDNLVESAGFYNLAGFNDDTRALLSIPARHDVWRRCTSNFLAQMVSNKALSISTAEQINAWLAYDAAKAAYRLP